MLRYVIPSHGHGTHDAPSIHLSLLHTTNPTNQKLTYVYPSHFSVGVGFQRSCQALPMGEKGFGLSYGDGEGNNGKLMQ